MMTTLDPGSVKGYLVLNSRRILSYKAETTTGRLGNFWQSLSFAPKHVV